MGAMRFGFRAVSVAVALPLFLGCSTQPTPAAPNQAAAVGKDVLSPLQVTDADFAQRAYQLVLEGTESRPRTEALVGVVRHQLRRAELRFDRGSPNSGLRAVLGALLLLRAGEHRPEIATGGERPLSAAAAEVARLGQEGYSVALYELLQSVAAESPLRREVQAHLQAIDAFSKSTTGEGQVQSASTAARVAVQRALLESTQGALSDATEKLVAWIRRALEFNSREQPIRDNGDREEPIEAYLGQRDGPIVLSALYLRHGDPRGALKAMDDADLSRLVPPALRDHLERSADDHDPQAWGELYRYFNTQAESQESPFDRELMAGAAWGTALSLFRSEPSTLRGSMPISVQLITRGMAEVAALILANSVTKSSSPEEVGLALGLVLNAAVAEDGAGQLNGARRTFEGGHKLLELAESRAFQGKISPSPARAYYVMAAIEARHADLERAAAFLKRSTDAEGSPEGWTMTASIERQRGNVDAALAAVERVLEIARKDKDAVLEVDALLQKFELLRDAKRGDVAAKTLDTALVRAIEATKGGRPGPSQARLERLLTRVIEQYGDPAALRRATARAFDAAGGDARQLAAIVLDTARRALTRGDLQLARSTAQRAIEAGLSSDEIVYVALWLQLLERRFKAASDGTVEEAYASIEETSGWPAKLRAWARRKLTDSELIAAARSAAERIEASFYIAMNDQVLGKPGSAERLREVAKSPAIDLMEVSIARDLLAPPQRFTVPASVTVP